MPATRRLKLGARDTARARRDTDALTETIELSRAELADTLTTLTGHLAPRHLTVVAAHTLRARFNAHPAPFIDGGAALVLLLRGRRHEDHRPRD